VDFSVICIELAKKTRKTV